MSIVNDMKRIQQAKQDIKNSIENKGVKIKEQTRLVDYPVLIDTIRSDISFYLWNVRTIYGTTCSELFLFSQSPVIDLSSFNTSNVTNMNCMFEYCKSTSINLTNCNTSNVTNMGYMFHACGTLTSVDVSNFDTSNVTDMGSMFNGCVNLTSLDVSNFDTSKVTSMGYMFNRCSNLTSLDVSNFDTSKVTSMGSMFRDCSNLTTILGEIDLSNTKYIKLFFENCTELTEIHLVNICKNTISDSANYDLDLGSTKINTECLLEIINELPDTSSKGFSRILTLPTINTLTEAQVQPAINKGWNVANIKY